MERGDMSKVTRPMVLDDTGKEMAAAIREVAEAFRVDVGGGGGVNFDVDETLKLEDGILSVNTAKKMEKDNTLPITSAAVYMEVGNINALLETI